MGNAARGAVLVAAALAVAGLQASCKDCKEAPRTEQPPVVTAPTATPKATPGKRPRRASDEARDSPYSNIYPEDYVGPQVCAECHTEQHTQWRAHAHSKMNQDASDDTVVGDFSGVELVYGGGRVVFERRGSDFLMTLHREGAVHRVYKVTRTVGSRFSQMYIGIQLSGPEYHGHLAYSSEVKLPFGWWMKRKRWFPEVYFDSDYPPEYGDDGAPTVPTHGPDGHADWKSNCIWCHNTYAYDVHMSGNDPKRIGFPPEDLTLKVQRRTPTTNYGGHTVEPSELVSLGISCESCHFGGREHAVEGWEIRFVPSSPDLDFPKTTPAMIKGARKDPYVINAICAQCHSSNASAYPDGSGTWNSREARDMRSGACASAIKCTDCHDPHVAGPAQGGGPDLAGHIDACLGCHKEYRSPRAAARHTRHPPETGVTCLDCHMPRMVQGLDDVTRAHLISSPTNPEMYDKGMPNACNLCHLDRSVQWTLEALSTGWEEDLYPLERWKKWYGGSLDTPVGAAWLKHPKPVVRLVAADAYARSPLGAAALPEVLKSLSDEIAVNRMFGLFAVERILGRQLTEAEYSPTAPPDVRAEQVKALEGRVLAPPKAP